MLFYNTVRLIVAGGLSAVYRARMRGRDRLPAQGGYVLAPSHRSMMDIPFAAWLSRRPLRYMGKASLFRIPVVGSFFRRLGGFEVARDGTDRKALRDSIAMLQAGEVLLVYPEGTRQLGPKIQPLQPGAAYLALRSGVDDLERRARCVELLRISGDELDHAPRLAGRGGEPRHAARQ